MPARLAPAAVVLALAGCGIPCDPDLDTALRVVRGKTPTWRAAKERTDKVWMEAHGTTSLTGFGATLVQVEALPSLEEPIPHDVPASGRLDEPSLLFFQKTDGPDDEWPLIGVGYHRPFDPCSPPLLDDGGESIASSDWFIHEAGWHHVPVGDGGFTPATASDVNDGVTLDEAGCKDVAASDLRGTRPLFIAHGRAWTTHVWFVDDGNCPALTLTDPWGRTDCVARAECLLPFQEPTCERSLDVVGRAFFQQGDCSGVCATTATTTP